MHMHERVRSQKREWLRGAEHHVDKRMRQVYLWELTKMKINFKGDLKGGYACE